jgi:hypothetical protein
MRVIICINVLLLYAFFVVAEINPRPRVPSNSPLDYLMFGIIGLNVLTACRAVWRWQELDW